ncbi:uncharacterized protein LOC112500029 [Cynara cardunculus var. scolymus]|uniref:Uncharacterized protein n=1 Tax=Cynara cardunculus var. scolymus TaxID=59895 RepID=A0A124SEV4_CYNCS|nr:uncharacterized protein LOC112500029 [Cynara cardunculus var. scolymus]KVI01278.1 hypothetical protein Ccrd_020442 [Cynara cardunculus var. scolymus]
MAASLMPIQPPVVVRASASTSGHQKSDSQRKSWWTPLFGWSSEPDYIDSGNADNCRKNTTTTTTTTLSARSGAISELDLDQRTVRSRISPGNFTEEKARKLRMLTKETESFHDAMYHSAIASRLASDFSDRSDL